MISQEEIEKLEQAAEKATPGLWEWANFVNTDGTEFDSKDQIKAKLAESVDKSLGLTLHGVCAKDDANEHIVVAYTGNGPTSLDNSEYIMRVCPPAILSLIAKLKAAEAKSAELAGILHKIANGNVEPGVITDAILQSKTAFQERMFGWCQETARKALSTEPKGEK